MLFNESSTLQYLKKIHVQIIVFNKKAVVKISRISNSKNPRWNLVKFRSQLFLVNVSIIVCWVFYFWLRINGKTIKALDFKNANLQICSICLRLGGTSLTKIQHLHIEPSETQTHTKWSMMLKMIYLYGFVRWTKCIWWTLEKTIICSFISFLRLQLNELLQSEIN